jgi:hypothetical protein
MVSVSPCDGPEAGKRVGVAEVTLAGPSSGSAMEVTDGLQDCFVRPGTPRSSFCESAKGGSVVKGVLFVASVRSQGVASSDRILLPSVRPGHVEIGRREFHLVSVVRVMGNWVHKPLAHKPRCANRAARFPGERDIGPQHHVVRVNGCWVAPLTVTNHGGSRRFSHSAQPALPSCGPLRPGSTP